MSTSSSLISAGIASSEDDFAEEYDTEIVKTVFFKFSFHQFFNLR